MRHRAYPPASGGYLHQRKSVSLAVLDRHVLELLDVLHTIATRLPQTPAPAAPDAQTPGQTAGQTATPATAAMPDDPTAVNPMGDEAQWQTMLARLTEREMELFRRIGQGQSNREIAAARFRSVRTIETYRYRIRTKLGLKDPSTLAQRAWCYAHLMLSPALAA